MRKKRVFYNVFSSVLLQVITVISGLIVPKLIISAFGTSTNGLISSATQFLSYITLLEAGIGGVARACLYKPLSNKDYEKIISIIYSVEVFFKKIAIIFLAYLLILALIFKYISNSPLDYITTFTLVIIVGFCSFVQYYFGISYQILLQADQKQYITNIIQVITILINTVIVYITIKAGFNIIFVKLISSLLFVIRPIAIHMYVKKRYNISYSNKPKPYKIEQKYDGLAHHIAYFLHTNTDIVIITIFLNVSYVSVYSIYNMVASGLRNMTATFLSGSEAAFGNMIAKKEYDNLKSKFNVIEFITSSVSCIFFITGFIMIEDFISVYMKGITDFNYHIPLLGYFLLYSEFVYCIRQPFHLVTMAAGDFKNTKNAAWIEAILNIILSLVFVKIYGIVGVAIATAIAMSYRTIYYVIYLSKNIIYRNISEFFIKRLVTIALIFIVSYLTFNNYFLINVFNYQSWIIKSSIVALFILIITIIISLLFYREQIKYVYDSIMQKFKKIIKKKCHNAT